MDEKSSCWIHASQPWGGAGYGGTNLPRVGQEVLVDFLGGDPDRPIITGRVYTNLQKTPYKLPDNKTQSGWKSNSTGGTGGYNEIMFEDAGGQELVRVQAEKDMHKLVKNDEESTRRARPDALGAAEREREHREEPDQAGGRERAGVIGQNHSVTVGVNRSTQVGSIDSTMRGGHARGDGLAARGGRRGQPDVDDHHQREDRPQYGGGSDDHDVRLRDHAASGEDPHPR